MALVATPVARRRANVAKENDTRVASRGKRDASLAFFGSTWRLPNPDPTLRKHSTRDGIGLYSRIIQQFPFVPGYMGAWIDHLLVTDRVIKAAEAETIEDQALADEAAARANRAWARVRNRVIVLQKLLTARYYGFARAEKVWRFDEVVKEWIPDLYDVPQECWRFDDDGRDYLVTALNPFGIEVPSDKFIHLQWGSADTKYGFGDLSKIYLAIWYIQKIQDLGLEAIEMYGQPFVIVHVPKSIVGNDRLEVEQSFSDSFKFVCFVPSDEQVVRTEMPGGNIAASGSAGRQEYEAIRFYERWIQICLLGAPQTQDKAASGNGKLDEVRSGIWEDKTPLGNSALDQCLTEGWLDAYFDANMPDLKAELRSRFESDAEDAVLTAAQSKESLLIGLMLAAQQITELFAIESWMFLGVRRRRAQAIAKSIIKQRAALVTAPVNIAATPSSAGGGGNVTQQQEAA